MACVGGQEEGAEVAEFDNLVATSEEDVAAVPGEAAVSEEETRQEG